MTLVMAPWHPQSRRSASAWWLADRRRACTALIAAVTLIALSSPAGAYAAGALARTTDALTGMTDASQLTAQSVCQPASATRATCDAEMLVNATGRVPVHPRLAEPAYPQSSAARFGAKRQSMPAGEPEPQPGSPAYMQQAYDLSFLSQSQGAGDTVALVDAYDDPNAEADLAAYRSYFGLPACSTANGCFRKVDQEGGQALPSPSSGWTSEISLDLDAVSAICPRCNILLVEANSNDSADLLSAQAEADALGANQISDSWGGAANSPSTGDYTFPGVATVASAGDGGYLGPLENQYPAALPDVTAAGGTALLPASTSGIESARGFTEQAWSSTGSGCDSSLPRPTWQPNSGCDGRAYSDLSANANPQTGLDVYDSADGGWVLMGGTSESAPLIAAYYAITGASAATPAWAYQRSSLFNAPVGSSNGTCALAIAFICIAELGYNGPTGVGSISGAVATGAPGVGGPGPSGSYTQSAGADSAQLQAGIYPNGSDTTYRWQYGTTTAYGHSTAAADVGSGQAPVSVSSTLPGLAAGTTYHYRLAAQNAFGTTYGYDFTLTTTAPTAPTVSAVRTTVTGERTVKLTARLDGQGGAAAYHFVYGTGKSYRHRTATVSVSAGTGTRVTATITGLSAHTTYHVRLVATNAGGLAESPARTFTTARRSLARGRHHHGRHSARHR